MKELSPVLLRPLWQQRNGLSHLGFGRRVSRLGSRGLPFGMQRAPKSVVINWHQRLGVILRFPKPIFFTSTEGAYT